MAAPNQATHFLLNLEGSYRSGPASGGVEIWQTGVRLIVTTALTEPPPLGTLPSVDIVEDIVSRSETAWDIDGIWRGELGVNDFSPSDFLNDQAGPAAQALITNAIFASDVQIDALKLYPVSTPAGKIAAPPGYSQGAPVTLAYTGTKPSGAGSQGLPPQDAVVASLRTPQTGRRGRGRMYLPPFDRACMSNLVLSSAVATSTAAAMVAFLEALTLDGDTSGVWVTPIVTGAPYTAYGAVNSVQIGNVIDTQQRRRASIEETRTISPVDPFVG